jgi:hypothetical protein
MHSSTIGYLMSRSMLLQIEKQLSIVHVTKVNQTSIDSYFSPMVPDIL